MSTGAFSRTLVMVRHMARRHNLPREQAKTIRMPRPPTPAERVNWKETPTAARLLDR